MISYRDTAPRNIDNSSLPSPFSRPLRSQAASVSLHLTSLPSFKPLSSLSPYPIPPFHKHHASRSRLRNWQAGDQDCRQS